MEVAEELREIKDRRTIEPLIVALQSREESVQESAAYALKGITGQDFGVEFLAWKNWWKKIKI